MSKMIVGALFALLLCSGPAMAACSSYPYTLTNATTADATQVMANFNCAALTQGATLTTTTFAGATTFPGSTTVDGSGNIGIATASPTDTLTVGDFSTGHTIEIASSATGFSSVYFGHGTGTNRYDGYVQYNHSNNNLIIGTSQVDRILISSSGWLFPNSDNAQQLGQSGNRWSVVYAANGTIQTSDSRLKKNIVSLDTDDGLSAVMKLRPVTFQWKDASSDHNVHYGFIAQEVQKVLPKVVDVGTDSRNTLGINYQGFIPSIVMAVQELNQKVESGRGTADREASLKSLASLVRRQQAQISRLEAANSNELIEIGFLRAQVGAVQHRIGLQTARR